MRKETTDKAGNQGTVATNAINCLILVPSLIRAGAETQAVDLANGLAARGHSIHLCSFEQQLDQRDRLSGEIKFHHLLRKKKYDLSLIKRLAALIDREGIEIVQGVMSFATLIAWLASRLSQSKPPVVGAIHTTIQRGLKQELHTRILYRRMLRRLPAVIYVCEHQRAHWIKKYPELERSSTVVHNGVAPGLFRRDDFVAPARQFRIGLDIPEGAFVFACIAAFRPEKGQSLLVEAFAQVRDDAYLVFAGDGDLRADVEVLAESAGLKERTRFLGNISDIRPLIVASNATVLASTAVETFSMAMLESMALGVPMIAPRIGGLHEAIIDGETGLLFPVGDSAELARCMSACLENPHEAARMGSAAELKVAQSFTLEKMVKGTERVYLGVLGAI